MSDTLICVIIHILPEGSGPGRFAAGSDEVTAVLTPVVKPVIDMKSFACSLMSNTTAVVAGG